jgi:hypothetical protein
MNAELLPITEEPVRPTNAFDLAPRIRSMLLLAPLFRLAALKAQQGNPAVADALSGLDTHHLSMALFDFLIVGAEIAMGRTRDECRQFLEDEIARMRMDLSDEVRSLCAEYVVRGLENAQKQYQQFAETYHDGTSRTTQTHEFRLIDVDYDVEDQGRLKLSREGTLAFMDMLEVSVELTEEILQKIQKLLIERGQYAAALQTVGNARAMLAQYRSDVLNDIQRAKRNIRDIDWVSATIPRLRAARAHIDRRSEEDLRQLQAVNAALERGALPASEPHLLALREALEGCAASRRRLLAVVMDANDEFLDAQLVAFRVHKRRVGGDVAEVLNPGLGAMPTELMAAIADRVLYGAMPLRRRTLFSIPGWLSTLATPTDAGKAPDEPGPDAFEGTTDFIDSFPESLRQHVQDRVESLIERHLTTGAVDMDRLLTDAEIRALPEAERMLAIIVLYHQFNHRERFEARVEGEYRDADVIGARLVFGPKES